MANFIESSKVTHIIFYKDPMKILTSWYIFKKYCCSLISFLNFVRKRLVVPYIRSQKVVFLKKYFKSLSMVDSGREVENYPNDYLQIYSKNQQKALKVEF